MIVWDVVEFDLKKKKGLGCGEGKILEKVLLLKRQYLLIKFTLSSISIYYVLLGDSKKGEFNTWEDPKRLLVGGGAHEKNPHLVN